MQHCKAIILQLKKKERNQPYKKTVISKHAHAVHWHAKSYGALGNFFQQIKSLGTFSSHFHLGFNVLFLNSHTSLLGFVMGNKRGYI